MTATGPPAEPGLGAGPPTADLAAPHRRPAGRSAPEPGPVHDLRLVDLDTLTRAQEDAWATAYRRYGTRLQQSPGYARAVRAAGQRVVVALAPLGIIAFTREGEVLTAVGGDEPVLTEHGHAERLAHLVTSVRRATGASVYLPLVDAAHAGACARAGCTTWRRPPNSLIDWSRDGADLWGRALERGTSQLRRKRRLVERDGLTVRPGQSGAHAFAHVLAVDDRSWKAEHGQSMRLRGGQDALYGRLVGTGEITAAILFDGERPVAFRLDARVNDRLTSLKWSYDETYRRYSPGLHLLTEGLRQEWAGRGVRTVDLHGSPDTLKNLLYSERVPRADVWCGAAEPGALRARERAALDARVTRAHQAGKGLRHAFG
ncbi:GNAT family N-acetyltransferase [Streptomyces celluloflavus]|uniref:GNAT family N-acetyltransferase n=1 Tax=Streptomyces celluloflavus TaxID=58344 RepID=A0ABW7RND2_9ACTN